MHELIYCCRPMGSTELINSVLQFLCRRNDLRLGFFLLFKLSFTYFMCDLHLPIYKIHLIAFSQQWELNQIIYKHIEISCFSNLFYRILKLKLRNPPLHK